MTRRLALVLAALVLAAAFSASPAVAAEAPNHPFRFEISLFEPSEHVVEDFEGPCGLALDIHGDIYVGNYYHDEIDAFRSGGRYVNRTLAEEPLDGPCGLAVDAAGNLYVNNLHRNVLRFALSGLPLSSEPRNGLTTGFPATLDTQHSTGLALDPASGNLYVDDRTYIAEYKAPIFEGEVPIRIGEGTLEDGYGVAVSGFAATEGFLYVPDAASGTVKVYDPATDLTAPVAEIDGAGTPQHGFASLTDAAVAVDDSDGHVFVADDLQSLDYEHPLAALDEFNPAGEFRGQLPEAPVLYAGEPNGLVIDNFGGASQGDVYVTSGNTELAEVYAYGPTGPAKTLTITKSGAGDGAVTSEPAGVDCGAACVAEYNAGAEVTLTATADPDSAFAGWSGACSGSGSTCTVTMSAARSVGAEFEVAPPAAEPGIATGSSAVAPGPSSPAGESKPPSAPRPRVSTSARHRSHHPRKHRRHRWRHR